MLTEAGASVEMERWIKDCGRDWLFPLLEWAVPHYRGTVSGSRLTITGADGRPDPAHDECHLDRVWRMALKLGLMTRRRQEDICLHTVVTAAICHDLVVSCKADPVRRPRDTEASAKVAEAVLTADWRFILHLGYGVVEPALEIVRRCSSSAGNGPPLTLPEACVRDADGLDQLGVIGLLRIASLAPSNARTLATTVDPLARKGVRAPADETVLDILARRSLLPGVDAFYTPPARLIAARRIERTRAALNGLEADMGDLV